MLHLYFWTLSRPRATAACNVRGGLLPNVGATGRSQGKPLTNDWQTRSTYSGMCLAARVSASTGFVLASAKQVMVRDNRKAVCHQAAYIPEHPAAANGRLQLSAWILVFCS
jgi:hypothetical protein